MPVIVREMRVSARHPSTYYLRSLGAAALLVTCVIFGFQQGFTPNEGRVLFGGLHLTLFLSIWIIVPLLAADCISSERRNGTLGLLFLTLLRPQEVVGAKGFAHGLRALTLWLAVIPALMIPFLLGGVGWHEAVLSVLVNLSAVCFSLAAGLLASSASRRWSLACLLAMGFAGFMLIIYGLVVGHLLWFSVGPRIWSLSWQDYSESVVVNGLAFVSSFTWAGPSYSRWISSSQLVLITSQATLVSFVFLALSIYAAGASVRRTWQDKPPSRAQVWFRETFCTPKLWLSFFRRWMRRKLERNPIGWLEQRTWSGRVVTWGWFAVVVSLYSAVLTDRHFFRNYSDLQQIMAWLLMGSMALSAAGSFRRERESGVLELLLVSPLSESRIILGRLRGLWGQFFPSVVLLLAIWGYFSTLLRGNEDIPWISFHALTFLALPVIGLYFSLNSRNVLSAFLLTIAVAVLIPIFLPSAFYALTGLWGWHPPLSLDDSSGPSSLLQWIFAAICWGKMHGRLKRRDFPLDRKET